MDIFLGAETEGAAGDKWFWTQKEIAPLFKKLNEKDYGENLKSIGIISIIMRYEIFENGWKERRYFSRENKDADIRLRIDYKKFVRAKEKERKKIYMDHILEAIRIAGTKAGKEFDTERLLSDVKNVVNYPLLDLTV